VIDKLILLTYRTTQTYYDISISLKCDIIISVLQPTSCLQKKRSRTFWIFGKTMDY